MTQPTHDSLVADLHTPEELLATAEALLASHDPKLRRAVVLEAITALEAFVHRTVFGVLDRTMDPLLVKWLDEKTRMDFDARLGVLTPVATGRPVDRNSERWAQYKRAKEIRNRVTHSGHRVSATEAAFVLETVRAWLGHLGSTGDMALALAELKHYIESSNLAVPDEVSAVRIVRDYFGQSRAAATDIPIRGRRRADLVLKFGNYSVLVETKMVRGAKGGLEARIQEATWQAADYIREAEFTRAAVLIFCTEPIPEAYQTVRTVQEGAVSVVVIRVGP